MRIFFPVTLTGITLLVLNRFLLTKAAVVSSNGGYQLSIAFQPNEPLPEDFPGFFENIKSAFATFSTHMWTSTHHTFFIQHVDIVVPATWNLTTTFVAPGALENADVRISQDFQFPFVQNPNLCGMPGDFVELPNTFFDDGMTHYGEAWKALLVLWARYRWGVYEEHGFPGNDRFPYFSRDVQNDSLWVPTGCSAHQRLLGDLRQLDGTSCNAESAWALSEDCRFHPHNTENDLVTSSLMHFHFLESVTRFCDEETHEKEGQNRQNVYCDNKSVMETIRMSPDFKAVTVPRADGVPPPTFRISAPSTQPLLYVVIDRSIRSYAKAGIILCIVSELERIFREDSHQPFPADMIVGVGQFPSEITGHHMNPVVPLGLLGTQRDLVREAISSHKIINNQLQDVGLVLLETIDMIKVARPQNEANILVFKSSPPPSNASEFTSEREVELALRSENIKLFAIEVTDPEEYLRDLTHLALASGGDSIAISNAHDASLKARQFLMQVINEFHRAPNSTSSPQKICWKGEVRPNHAYKLLVPPETQELTFHFVTSLSLEPEDIKAGVETPEVRIYAEFSQAIEYSQGGSGRFVYDGFLNTTGWQNLKEVTFSYDGVVPGHLLLLSEGGSRKDDFTIDISTSGDHLDLGNVSNPQAPFVVSVAIKSRRGGIPIVGANVSAVLELRDELRVVSPLLDSGSGTEDVTRGDGIYSGVILPPLDGVYVLHVIVTTSSAPDDNTKNLISASSVMSLTQDFPMTPPSQFPAGFYQVMWYAKNIVVSSAQEFIPVIQKVRDLRVMPEGNSRGTFMVTFTAPKVLLQEEDNLAPRNYTLCFAGNKDILTDVDPTKPLPPGIDRLENYRGGCDRPGEICQFPGYLLRESTLYFALIPWSENATSTVSNIAMLESLPEDPPTPTTTTHFSFSPDISTTQELPCTKPLNTTAEPPRNASLNSRSTPMTSTTPGFHKNSTWASTTTFRNETLTSGTSWTSSSSTTDWPGGNKEPWVGTTKGALTVGVIALVMLTGAGSAFWVWRRRHVGGFRLDEKKLIDPVTGV